MKTMNIVVCLDYKNQFEKYLELLKRLKKFVKNYSIKLHMLSNSNIKSNDKLKLMDVVDIYQCTNMSLKLNKYIPDKIKNKTVKIDLYKLCIPSIINETKVLYINLESGLDNIEEFYSTNTNFYICKNDENTYLYETGYIKEREIDKIWLNRYKLYNNAFDNIFTFIHDIPSKSIVPPKNTKQDKSNKLDKLDNKLENMYDKILKQGISIEVFKESIKALLVRKNILPGLYKYKECYKILQLIVE